MENKDIKNIKYLAEYKGLEGDFSYLSQYKDKASINNPWPTSPNMIPKRKGNVTIENMAGFTSL